MHKIYKLYNEKFFLDIYISIFFFNFCDGLAMDNIRC